MPISASMQPIATPVETIDSTIGLRAVARSQVERAVLERICFDHHHFLVRIAVVLIGAKSDVAIDTRELFELIEVTDNLLWLGPDGLHGLGDHPRTVIAERDPPQQRVAHVDLGVLETVYEGGSALWKLFPRAITNIAEIVRVNLCPIFGLFQQRLCLPRTKRGLANDRDVPTHVAAGVDDAREKAGIDAPGHDGFRSCRLHTQKFGLQVRISSVNIALIYDFRALGLEHRHIGVYRRGAIAGSVADHRDLFALEHFHDIAICGGADLLVSGRVTEAHRIFLRVGQSINPARMDLRCIGTREQGHDRERLAGIDRAKDYAHVLPV